MSLTRRSAVARRIGGFILGAVLALSLPAMAQQAELTPENMKKAAFVLLQRGQPARALALADAVLTQFPEDATALILKSKAERDMGRYGPAHSSAKLAWAKAQDPRDQYGAALAAAQSLSSDGQKFRAQFWLRRAMQVAPTERAKMVAEKDFAYVKTRSRLALKFDLSIDPSSNVNNGSSSDIVWFLGLPFLLSGDAKALSGVTATLGVSGRYRLAETETAKTDLRFSIAQSTVALSGSAKAQAPAARGGDYAYSAIEVGMDRYMRPSQKDEVHLGLAMGRNWFGGDPMSYYLRGAAEYRRDLTKRVRASASVSRERQFRDDAAIRSADVTRLSFGLDSVLGNRDRLRMDVTATDTASSSSDIDHRSWGVSLDWTRAKPLLKGRVTIGLMAEGRDYDRSRYSADGRHDLTIGADLSMAFEEADYMGFIPILSLKTRHTGSNVSLFDSHSTGLGFSVQSKF